MRYLKTRNIYEDLTIYSKDGTEIFFGYSESFGFRIITSETLSETRNLNRNPKPRPKPRNLNRNPETAKTSIIYLFILSKVGAETLLCQIRKVQALDYSFRNLIQNSKPHPTPETSFETWNLTWTPKTTQTSICCINVLYISFKCTDVCYVSLEYTLIALMYVIYLLKEYNKIWISSAIWAGMHPTIYCMRAVLFAVMIHKYNMKGIIPEFIFW